MTIEKLKTNEEIYRTYVQHYHCISELLDMHVTDEKNMSPASIAAFTLTTLMLESYTNHLGEHVTQSWNRQTESRMSLAEKIETVHKSLNVNFNRHSKADKPLLNLIRQRNMLVHSSSVKRTAKIEALDSNEKADYRLAANTPEGEKTLKQPYRNIAFVRDDFSEAIIKKLTPTYKEAKNIFNFVVKRIELLDQKAHDLYETDKNIPYEGPFAASSVALLDMPDFD